MRSDSLKTITNYKYDKDRRLISFQRNYNEGKVGRFSYLNSEDNCLIQRLFYLEDTLIVFEPTYTMSLEN